MSYPNWTWKNWNQDIKITYKQLIEFPLCNLLPNYLDYGTVFFSYLLSSSLLPSMSGASNFLYVTSTWPGDHQILRGSVLYDVQVAELICSIA